MDIEGFREYCLSLPGVSEGTPFEKFSRGKFTMFCYFNIDDFSSITIKCDPGEMVELKERYQAIGEPFNGDKRYWISVQLGQDVPDDKVRELVSNSYRLVAQKYR